MEIPACSATHNSLCTCLWVAELNEREFVLVFFILKRKWKGWGVSGTVRENRLVESHISVPERNAVDGSLARVRWTLTLSPSGRRGDLKGEGEWKQVPTQGDRTIPPGLPFLSKCPYRVCMRLCNIRIRRTISGGEVLSWGSPRTSQSARWITTLGVKKERRVTVGDSLRREIEAPIC